jgi:uncharacterized protein (DUF1800 family)
MTKQGGPAAAIVSSSSGGGQKPLDRGGDPTFDLAPYQPSASSPWDRRRAAHLMRRAGFGGRPEEIEAIVALGPDRTLDLLLSAPVYQLPSRGGQVLPHGELLELTQDVQSQRASWLHECSNGFFPLREKLTLFWHDHFSVGSNMTESVPLLLPHINLLRQHALGRFRDMLVDVTKDPAMLWWLDNHLNGRMVNGNKQVNENYGRELLELYSMGVHGGYTQQDVFETSKCLSGWTLDGYDVFKYDPNLHLPGDKVVLGTTIRSGEQQEVYDLIDQVILPWPMTARYVAGKIWRYFVSPDPYPALIEELARRWTSSGFDIRALMSIVLRSNYFFSDRAIGSLVKNPVEFVIGAIRQSGQPIHSYIGLAALTAGMGYPLLRYSNPSGLPDGFAWLDSSALINRANFGNEFTRLSTTATLRNRFDPWTEIRKHNLTTGEQIVDHYLQLLLGDDVPVTVRAILHEFMHRTDLGRETFTLTQRNVDMKVRGLVHLILSLPEYQAN